MKLIFILFILIVLIILIFLLRKYKNIDNFENKNNKKAICILSTKLTDILYKFIINLKTSDKDNLYDYYICVDKVLSKDEILRYDQMYKNNKINKINIINIEDKVAESYGFKGSVLYFPDKACSRDKGLYYFSMVNNSYNHVWFIEEDVFFYNLDSIIKIDNKYNNSVDLILRDLKIKKVKEPLDWHWSKVYGKIDLPWACGMICIIRISKKLLKKIKEYALKNNTLFLDEAMFSTIAFQNNLNIYTPEELKTIYENDWVKMDSNNNDINKVLTNVNKFNFLHPVKNLNDQIKYREIIKEKL
jgi:hypothetical protein